MAALGIASAGLGLAKGVGGAIAAKKSFSPEMEERMRELERLRESGQMGLSEADRQGLEASLATQRGAGLRQAQTISEQQRQAAGGSGRELFLAEVAQADAEQQARVAGAEIISAQETAAQQAQQQELAALQAQEAGAKAAAISALTGGLVEGGQAAVGIAAQQQAQKQALEMQRLQADAQIKAAAAAAGYTTPESIVTGYMGG
jgi:hypothetical protein